MADLDEWSCNSSDALSITLAEPQPAGLKPLATFHPKFTYSIFGDDETIFGYQNLKIQLRYRANDMRPNLKVSYDKKIPPTDDVAALDIQAALKEGNHLPNLAFVASSDFEESSRQMTEQFVPPGSLYRTIHTADATYEVWKGSLAMPAVKNLVSRVQILVPLLIEGGSYLETDGPAEDSRWTVFCLYRTHRPGSYSFIGYSTVYSFFHFQTTGRGPRPDQPANSSPSPSLSPTLDLRAQDFDLADLPCRSRLSQFIILPPYQGCGNGARLYQTMFGYYLRDHPQTVEFTVEDPNEAFDDLRDLADLTYLRTLPEFRAIEIDRSIDLSKLEIYPKTLVADPQTLQSIRTSAKMAPRQFSRVLEMHLMSSLPAAVRPGLDADAADAATADPTPAAAYTLAPRKASKSDLWHHRLWRLFVKNRLYRQNRDLLAELEIPERIEKLDDTVRSVEFEYARLLAMHETWAKHNQADTGRQSDWDLATGKRKLEEDGILIDRPGASKRPRAGDSTEE